MLTIFFKFLLNLVVFIIILLLFYYFFVLGGVLLLFWFGVFLPWDIEVSWTCKVKVKIWNSNNAFTYFLHYREANKTLISISIFHWPTSLHNGITFHLTFLPQSRNFDIFDKIPVFKRNVSYGFFFFVANAHKNLKQRQFLFHRSHRHLAI